MEASFNQADLQKLFRKLKASSRRDVLTKVLFIAGIHLSAWVKEERLSGRISENVGLNVITNRLRSSITSSKVNETVGFFGREYYVTIGTNVKYAPKHEFGIGVPKRPFLKPAFEDEKNQQFVLDKLVEYTNQAIASA